MKKLIIVLMMSLPIFMISCGGCSNQTPEERAEKLAKKVAKMAGGVSESEYEEMKKELAQTAENINKAEEIMANETEEDKNLWSEKNIELLGLTIKERKISETAWQRATLLANAYKSLKNEEKKALTLEQIDQMILDAGFTDLDAAKNELKEISKSKTFWVDLGMKQISITQTRAINGKEEYEEEMRKLGEKINTREYSPQDLKAIEENAKITSSISEILYRLKQYK